MAETQLGLLGGFTLEVDGVAVDPPVGTQHLLACLALRGPAPRPHIGALLWPDLSESRSLACLRTVLWRVNKTLPGVVSTTRSDLALSRQVQLDITDVTRLASRYAHPPPSTSGEPDVERILTSRARLCSGPLLPGWYEDWVVEERDRLEQLRLHALESCAVWLLKAGETELALELALEAVRTEPLRESAAGTLISVHIAEGNMWEAFREFESYRHKVLAELGLPPSGRVSGLLPPEWRAVYESPIHPTR
ncbi:AfsR/SARP family transcriptional regulator [Serinicoccus sediminis]|uniref:AfsR/SARP family transcriptional regulator n=1 Tax=Serinicoccus sediminis TaxID=2306021 RepID=UPI0010213EA6|nr:BTAD domain-containing putative transcriptional regulator [Serinicoccus sediminis]